MNRRKFLALCAAGAGLAVLGPVVLSRPEPPVPAFEWLEDEYWPTADRLRYSHGRHGDLVKVTNGSYFRAGDVFRNERTREVFYVTAASGAGLTVSRAFGRSRAKCGKPGDPLFIIGNASHV